MHVIAGPLRKPSADLGMFVSGIVIDDEVDCESRGHALVEVTQEGEKLLMAVARLTFGEHLAIRDVQGSEQGGCAVAHVIMSNAVDIAQPHGQHRLGAVEGLNLALFVDAEDQSVIRWVEVQADDVAHGGTHARP